MSAAARLFDAPLVGLYPVGIDEANALIAGRWQHDLGPCERPFGQQAFVLEVNGTPAAATISASIVNGPVAGYERQQIVELARLAGEPWATRMMIRLWREVCAPIWPYWPVEAAVSYSLNTKTGNLYRFDGWDRITSTAGSTGGGSWSTRRNPDDPRRGSKTLWCWRYPEGSSNSMSAKTVAAAVRKRDGAA